MTAHSKIAAPLAATIFPTASGRLVDLLAPRPEDINLRDIAHALARLNRWGGHTRDSISVAQHTLLVAKYVPADCRVHALLHDAHEAYTGEVPSPMKEAQDGVGAAGGYRDKVGPTKCIEIGLDEVIYFALGLSAPTEAQRAAVHEADRRAAATEARDLLPPSVFAALPFAEPFPDDLKKPWREGEAETRLLEAFRQHFPRRQELWSR